MEHSSV